MPFYLIAWAQVLDGVTLARIYLGEIRYWNDSAIAALNAGLDADGKLPGELIRLGAYSDGTLEVTQVPTILYISISPVESCVSRQFLTLLWWTRCLAT
jgi:hypothetical protein